MALPSLTLPWSWDSWPDEKLAKFLQCGERGAFKVLFKRYQSPIYRFMLHLTGSVEESEDLVQEVFLRVYASIDTYSPGRPFRPWLYAVAKHLAWRRLKQRQRTAEWISLEDLPESGGSLPEEADTPEEHYEHQTQAEAIQRAMESLPEEQYLVFVLYHYQSLSYEEIAEIVDCPVGTVKSRMHYALVRLRQRLAYLREVQR